MNIYSQYNYGQGDFIPSVYGGKLRASYTARMQNNIRALRKARKITLEKLAEAAGLSTDHLSKIERGDRPLIDKWMIAIAPALGVRPQDLIAPPDSYNEEAMESAITALEGAVKRQKILLGRKERIAYLSRLYNLALREFELAGTYDIGAAAAEAELKRVQQ